MQIQSINSQHHQNFGIKFQLSKEAIKCAEESTGLTYKENTRLPFDKAAKLMEWREKHRILGKFQFWIAKTREKVGEKLSLLQNHYDI